MKQFIIFKYANVRQNRYIDLKHKKKIWLKYTKKIRYIRSKEDKDLKTQKIDRYIDLEHTKKTIYRPKTHKEDSIQT